MTTHRLLLLQIATGDYSSRPSPQGDKGQPAKHGPRPACVSAPELLVDDGHQVAEFGIHVARVGNRIGNNLTEQFAVTPSEPMNVLPDGVFSLIEAGG